MHGTASLLIGWFSCVDHKTLGIRFIVTAFCFFVLAGILAALMRLQLAQPDNTVLGPDLYNQVFTMHGVTMIFLVAMPLSDRWGMIAAFAGRSWKTTIRQMAQTSVMPT